MALPKTANALRIAQRRVWRIKSGRCVYCNRRSSSHTCTKCNRHRRDNRLRRKVCLICHRPATLINKRYCEKHRLIKNEQVRLAVAALRTWRRRR